MCPLKKLGLGVNVDYLISIIVPVYKVENELRRCVKSLLNQSYKKLEIILVDDGSPDQCPMICDEFEKLDTRVKVIHKENGGLSDARNFGLKESTGDYILFVDSDDYIKEEACYLFSKYFEAKVDIIVGNATVYENGKIKHEKHTNLVSERVYNSEDYLIAAISANEWYAPVCYNLYNREFLIKNNLYFKKGILHEDMEYLPRVFLTAKRIMYLDFEFYQYIIRDGSITQVKKYDKNIEDLIEIYSDWKKIFDNIDNNKLQKILFGALAKYYIVSCRKFHVSSKIYPEGVDAKFLVDNALNLSDFIKTMAFLLCRKIYVKM